ASSVTLTTSVVVVVAAPGAHAVPFRVMSRGPPGEVAFRVPIVALAPAATMLTESVWEAPSKEQVGDPVGDGEGSGTWAVAETSSKATSAVRPPAGSPRSSRPMGFEPRST